MFDGLVWLFGGNWGQLAFGVKMMNFVDFQRVYHDLSRGFGFDVLKSSRGYLRMFCSEDFEV